MTMSAEEMDHTPVTKGKYKGQTPSQIAEHDAWYVVNVLSEWTPQVVSDVLIEACEKDL